MPDTCLNLLLLAVSYSGCLLIAFSMPVHQRLLGPRLALKPGRCYFMRLLGFAVLAQTVFLAINAQGSGLGTLHAVMILSSSTVFVAFFLAWVRRGQSDA